MNAVKTPFTSLRKAIATLDEKLKDTCQSDMFEIGSVDFSGSETALASLVSTGTLFTNDALTELNNEIKHTQNLLEELCSALILLESANRFSASDADDDKYDDSDYADQMHQEYKETRDMSRYHIIEAMSYIEQILDQMEDEIEGA